MLSASLPRARVVAVIPAHNEQESIGHLICDLAKQTYPLYRILLVADNCTDHTVALTRWFCQKWFPHFPKITLMETKNNTARKAGAINQALSTLKDVDYVLLMDADTRLEERAIEVAVRKMEADKSLAALCSKAGVLPFRGRSWSWAGGLIYRLQKLEYANFDSQRVETLDTIKVVHGMTALHRWQALLQVGFFDEDNLVEDYELTIRYKENGWNVSVALDMLAWTKVPTSLGELWTQRLRWLRGGVDTLHQHGWNSATRADILQHIIGLPFMLLKLFLGLWVTYAVFKGQLQFHVAILLVMVLSLANMLYRLKYVGNLCLNDWLLRLAIFPEQVYGFFQTIVLVSAYIFSFTNSHQKW